MFLCCSLGLCSIVVVGRWCSRPSHRTCRRKSKSKLPAPVLDKPHILSPVDNPRNAVLSRRAVELGIFGLIERRVFVCERGPCQSRPCPKIREDSWYRIPKKRLNTYYSFGFLMLCPRKILLSLVRPSISRMVSMCGQVLGV